MSIQSAALVKDNLRQRPLSQYLGWWSQPGGGLSVLEDFRSDQPRLRCLGQQNELAALGVYLGDAFGNFNLVYRDPDVWEAKQRYVTIPC